MWGLQRHGHSEGSGRGHAAREQLHSGYPRWHRKSYFSARASRSWRDRSGSRFDDDHFYVDLVFYNVILKCHLLIDLKLCKLTHQDVGQMDSYVRLFDSQGRTEGHGPTIGLILCAEKNEAVARYSILHENEHLFAAKYVTYLPSVEELERELAREKRSLGSDGAATSAPTKRAVARGRRPGQKRK